MVEVKLHGVEQTFATLRALPAEIASKRGGPVRAALRKAAVVVQKQELANLQTVTSNATSAGKRLSTGFLAKNVVVTRGKAPLGSKGERFLVRVRRKTYPDTNGEVSTLKTAQLLEYGSSQQPAEPWIRPAVEGRGREAIETFERELRAGVDRAVRKLAKQNRSA
jgi:HK97 gp10 family phage protein